MTRIKSNLSYRFITHALTLSFTQQCITYISLLRAYQIPIMPKAISNFDAISFKLFRYSLWEEITHNYSRCNFPWSLSLSVNDSNLTSRPSFNNFGPSPDVCGSHWLLALRTCLVRLHLACGPLLPSFNQYGHRSSCFAWFNHDLATHVCIPMGLFFYMIRLIIAHAFIWCRPFFIK